MLWAQPMPMVYPFGKKPIDDFFNMKGFKMRVYSAEFAEFYTMLGGTGVFIPWEEVYTSLDKGVVDGYTSDIVKLDSLKLYEVIKYHYDMFMETNGCIWVMNQASFNALPKDLQTILDKALKDRVYQRTEEYVGDERKALDTMIKDYKVTISTLEPADQKKMMVAAMKEWDKVAAKDADSAKAIGMLKDYLRKLKYID